MGNCYQSYTNVHSRHVQVIWIQDKTGRVLRGLSHIPVPQMPAETSGEFLSHCLQISAGAHVQIVGEAIGTIEVKALTSQT